MASSETLLTARRYAELLSISKAALDTHDLIKLHETIRLEHVKFKSNHCVLIAIIFSLNALEAFINHLGYIFDDKWKSYESKNFWVQYERVLKVLERLGLEITKYSHTPYQNFEVHRDTIRNPAHHVHSSKHDVKYSRKDNIPALMDDLAETGNMLSNSWINLSLVDAKTSYEEIISFIKYFCKKFTEKHFQSNPLSRILSRSPMPEDDQRKALLRRFINDPLNPIPIVSGGTTLDP